MQGETLGGLSRSVHPRLPVDGRCRAAGCGRVRRLPPSGRSSLAKGVVRATKPAGGAHRRARAEHAPRRPDCRGGGACDRPGRRARPQAHALGRASPGASGERFLRVALRRGRGLCDRRLRRLRQHVVARGEGSRLTVLDRVYFRIRSVSFTCDHPVSGVPGDTATNSR